MGALSYFCLALLVQTSLAYRYFLQLIPNGNKVPHPCQSTANWEGVGHLRTWGGGPRNPFGIDFHSHNMTWTTDLCRKDSDGDGRTNGEELGDPNCVWRPGASASQDISLSHPGICEPWGSEKCRASNAEVDCSGTDFVCDEINSPDVFHVTLRFPLTKVPTSRYTYMCFTFELNMLEPGVDYHLIATKPYIDNRNALHHIQLNGCGPLVRPLVKPKICNMAASSCQHYLAIWTLGMPGHCVYKDAGFKISRDGTKWLTMQIHWKNTEGRDDLWDSSGLVLYLTNKLRKFNAGYWQTGQIHLNIPPQKDRHQVNTVCTSNCTRKQLSGPAYIMTAMNHMHYLGYGGNIAQYRNGAKVKNLTPDERYDFNDPRIHMFDPPHEILPGDVLDTTCVFRSTNRNTTTMFGESEHDEMCLGVMTYFPAENIHHDSCYTWKEFDICYVENAAIHGCAYYMIFNASDPIRKGLINKILNSCNFYGECRKECPAAIREVRQHPCFNYGTGPYIMDLLRALNPDMDLVKFLAAMQSCECENPGWSTPRPPVAAAVTHLPALAFITIMTLLPFLMY